MNPKHVVFTAGCGSAAAPVGSAGERGASEMGPCRQACQAAIQDCYHILGGPWQGPAESSDWMGAYQVSVEGRAEVSGSPLTNRVGMAYCRCIGARLATAAASTCNKFL